ncbi:MAG: hypothetical protein HYU43_07300 [Armatimonadetes bacterium]|nr:hypothetical protein [Armatimonadota bacterium]
MVRAPTPYAARGDVFAWAALIVTGIVALPRAIPWLAARSREQVFQQAAAATALPALATWLLLHSRAPSWLWVGVLLTFAAIFSVLRRPEAWVFLTRRTAAVAGLGIGVVLLLWLLITTAYRAQGIPIILIAPGTGWQRFALAQLIVAVAVEGWLRGYAFSALAESLGTGWARKRGRPRRRPHTGQHPHERNRTRPVNGLYRHESNWYYDAETMMTIDEVKSLIEADRTRLAEIGRHL